MGGEAPAPLGGAKAPENDWGGGAKNSFQKMSDKPDRKKGVFKTRKALEDPSIIIRPSGFQDRRMYAKAFGEADLGGKERRASTAAPPLQISTERV